MTEFNPIQSINDLTGKDGHVLYVPVFDGTQDEMAVPYQIDGMVLGLTEEAIEGQSVIIIEDEFVDQQDGEVEPSGLRSVPVEWVVGASEKGIK